MCRFEVYFPHCSCVNCDIGMLLMPCVFVHCKFYGKLSSSLNTKPDTRPHRSSQHATDKHSRCSCGTNCMKCTGHDLFSQQFDIGSNTNLHGRSSTGWYQTLGDKIVLYEEPILKSKRRKLKKEMVVCRENGYLLNRRRNHETVNSKCRRT